MDATLLVESKMMVAATFGLDGIPREPLVTIASVGREEQQQKNKKGKKERWGILNFAEEWAKPLKVNGTSRKALILMFGKETDLWIGKRLLLYAMPGIYFNEPGVAVRIKGSPDIAAPISFSVRKFGGGEDVYNLIKVGSASNGKAKTEPPPPYVTGIVWWGKSKGAQIAALSHDELEAQLLQYSTWLATATQAPATTTTRTNYDELLAEQAHRAELEKAMDAGEPPAGAPQTSAGDAPPS